MATISLFGRIDPAIITAVVNDGEVLLADQSRILVDRGVYRPAILGDFSYDAQLNLIGGTITSIDLSSFGPTPIFNISQLSVSLAAFVNDPEGTLQSIYNGLDTVTAFGANDARTPTPTIASCHCC